MKIFLVIFLGFTIGIIAGYTLVSPIATRDNIETSKAADIFNTTHPVNGFVEAINHSEQYFLLSVQSKYEKKARYVLKIYTDEMEFFWRSFRYIDNNTRYFDTVEDSPEDTAISVGDRLRVSFINMKSDKKFKARTITKQYYINT